MKNNLQKISDEINKFYSFIKGNFPVYYEKNSDLRKRQSFVLNKNHEITFIEDRTFKAFHTSIWINSLNIDIILYPTTIFYRLYTKGLSQIIYNINNKERSKHSDIRNRF